MIEAESIDLRARPQLIFWFALFVGATYYLARQLSFTGADMTAWKGAGVGLLALWALRHARGIEGVTLAAVLGAGAIGDVLLEARGLTIGAVAFLIGHLLATALYARQRWAGGWPAVLTGAAGVALLGYLLTGAAGVALYAAALGAMAGAASLGRLGRAVSAGAWLFVISDLLLFARLGPLASSALPGLLIWPTYFAGQALIAWGGVTALTRREGALEGVDG